MAWSAVAPDTGDLLVRVEGRAGRITLNRPRAINALTLDMVRGIAAALDEWAQDPAITLVLLDGAGERGLCAGGDIRALYDAAVAGEHAVIRTFFHAEYRMNAQIAQFKKPYVAFMDGLVMGGGVGVSAHGSLRVVTERTRLAMPETGIGFLPDVGATWLLGRAPDCLGLHAALTATPLGAADAILCGLADVYVPSARLNDLANALTRCPDSQAAAACVQDFAADPPPGILAGARAWIATCYAAPRMEGIVAALQAHESPAAQAAAAEITRKSPTSLKVTLRALREAPALGSLEACLEREYLLALAVTAAPEFREGVRAAVVDKDRNPAWSPAVLNEVADAVIGHLFDAPNYGGLGLTSTSQTSDNVHI